MMDYTVGDTIRKCFTTRAFATGIPTVLAGTPVLSVYEDGSITQITAGVSVTVDLDSVVGLNQLVIVATGGNGFDAGSDYSVVITTGTVGGVSVVGETVYTFSLGRSAAFTRLGAPAGASVSADIAVIEGQTDDIGVAGAGLTAINLPNQTMDITGNLSGSVGSVTAQVTADMTAISGDTTAADNAESFFDGTGYAGTGNVIPNVTLVATTTTNTDTAASLGTPSDFGSGTSTIAANLQDMADNGTAVFDRSTDSLQAIRDRGDVAWTTGSGTGLTAFANGTAQGGTSSTIQLASGETFADSEPNGNMIKITSGTGSGQSRVILSYVGSTDTATVSPNWTTTPDATSVYEMVDGSANITAVSNAAEDIATATSITALNDVAATDIVSSGAITTSSGAVSNVTLVATTTTNTDVRGTDSAALASVCTEVRLAELDAANLPTTIDDILTDTGTTLPAQITALNNISVSDILTTQMTQAYAADGVAPTLAQSLFLIQQILGDFGIAGTTLTVREIDGSTTAATFTLDDGTNPTDLTRAT